MFNNMSLVDFNMYTTILINKIKEMSKEDSNSNKINEINYGFPECT